jgi:chromate reductase, NAD(P)H dehydrogenase (quinone)
MSPPLRVALLLGSTRVEGPPHPVHLGKRVGKFIEADLAFRGFDVVVIDAAQVKLELLRKPHFAYARNRAPAQLENIAQNISHADCFVMVTPEYNHAPSPALLNILVSRFC